jgi:hypothetical protein
LLPRCGGRVVGGVAQYGPAGGRWGGGGGPPARAPTEAAMLRAEPCDARGRALPVTRLVLDDPALAGLEPEEVVLARGRLRASSIDELLQGAPSESLAARLVPMTRFHEAGSTLLRSHVPLAAGEAITVGWLRADGTAGHAELVVAEDPATMLTRVWPPAGTPVAGPVVVCDAAGATASWAPLADAASPDPTIELDPKGHSARIRVGSERGIARWCAWISFDAPIDEAVTHLPPSVRLGEAVTLDPSPIAPLFERERGATPLSCSKNSLEMGPGCLRVEDDRLFVETPAEPTLWVVRAADRERMIASPGGTTFAVRGLPVDATVTVEVEVVDRAGTEWSRARVVRTMPPRPRLVLSEVYANAIGPEPAQEWVELYNDGGVEASTAGYVLEDVGGEAELPEGTIPPGGFALVVGDDFDPNAAWDLSPAPGTLLLRVPRVGKSGLANSGEPLLLRDPQGAIVARFESRAAPKPGVSAAVADLQADDFTLEASDPPTPGAPPLPR